MSTFDDPPPEGSASPGKTGTGSGKRGGRKAAQRGIIAIGAVLNGIYEVRRLIARGGMGEVYEGVNVNAEERVAIKVILPHLAADEKVQAMFRKEAKTLTSFAHPALVQYRVLAREPRRDVLYIVTDFIDGEPLSALIGKATPNTSELVMLTRRLAEGLGAAHGHGAIHRDISPDNVLLPDGVLSQAKIIDFGIAKSMDVGAQTVVGDGFAGKLGYVAPEQFGDFGRKIGPWTDIYSLGLVILALAGGRAPDMGTTLVEAIDRRRAGPDISVLPASLRPLFSRMLTADPEQRLQAMAEVIAGLDAVDLSGEAAPRSFKSELSSPPTDMNATVIGDPSNVSSWQSAAPAEPKVGEEASAQPTPAPVEATIFQPPSAPPGEISLPPSAPGAAPEPPKAVVEEAPVPPPAPTPQAEARQAEAPKAELPKAEPAKVEKPKPQPPAPKAAGDDPLDPPAKSGPPLALIGGLVGLVILAVLGFAFWPKGPKPPAAPPEVAAAPPPPVDPQLQATAVKVPCSWVDVRREDGARILVTGIAADPIAVNKAASDAAKAAGQQSVEVDTSGVLVANQGACPLLDAVRPLHSASVKAVLSLVAQQETFEVDRGIQGCPAGLWAQPMVTLTTDAAKSFTLIGIQASGRLRQLVSGQDQFRALAAKYPENFKELGAGRYRISICQNETGLAGVMAVEGAAPFELGLKPGALARPPADLADRLSAGAASKGWIVQTAWFRIANAQADRPETAVAQVKAPTGAPAQAPAVVSTAGVPPVDAPAATPATGTKGPADWSACRRFKDGVWEELGYASRAVCVQRIFAGRCDTLTGRSGDLDLRRYNGFIQGKSDERAYRKWTNIVPSDCPK